jgi:hypothetical protein
MNSDAINKKIQGMTNEEREQRLDELNKKLGVTSPHSTSGGTPPPVLDMDELLERELLKEVLGY